MAKKSLIDKCKKRQRKYNAAVKEDRQPKFPTRVYNRCGLCGRPHGYMRKFDMCRICFRDYARKGLIMGVKKSSW